MPHWPIIRIKIQRSYRLYHI